LKVTFIPWFLTVKQKSTLKYNAGLNKFYVDLRHLQKLGAKMEIKETGNILLQPFIKYTLFLQTFYIVYL